MSALVRPRRAGVDKGVDAGSTAGANDRRGDTDPLSVVHVLSPAEVGGLESVVLMLARGMAARGHTVRVVPTVAPDEADHPFVAALRAADVEVLPVRVPGRAYRAERTAVAELCRRLRPDVVHTHGYRSDVVDGGVARALGIATATTVHGFTGGGARNWVYERLQLLAFRRFDAVVAVSRPLAARLAGAGVPRARIHLVSNAFAPRPTLPRDEARRRLGIGDGGFVVGWVGRLTPEKGADVMLDALVHLGDLPTTLHVLGDGPERSSLTVRAAAHGVTDRVVWHGVVSDAATYFPAFDAFVLSSRTEGTPIALLEGMAAGVPTAVTRVGGVPDVVTPTEALLVPPDEPTALAAALRAIHDDPTAAARRAHAARARLETAFAVEPWVARYLDLYRAIRRPTLH